MKLTGNGQTIDLYPWSQIGPGAAGIQALAGVEGFGLPGVTPRWFEGAGAGSRWRGSRFNARDIPMPLYVAEGDTAGLNRLMSQLAVVLDPSQGKQARLSYDVKDPGGVNDEWWLDVVRQEGGDYKRQVDSDGRTYIELGITLRAGDPFWTRSRAEQTQIRQQTSGRLMPRLARLRLASAAAFGTKVVTNPGNAPAYPTWYIAGPLDQLQLIGARGERLVWNGKLLLGDTLVINTRAGTIVDGTGANRYGELDVAPKFWSIAPGDSTVSMVAVNAGLATSITAQWFPRRQVVV